MIQGFGCSVEDLGLNLGALYDFIVLCSMRLHRDAGSLYLKWFSSNTSVLVGCHSKEWVMGGDYIRATRDKLQKYHSRGSGKENNHGSHYAILGLGLRVRVPEMDVRREYWKIKGEGKRKIT